MRDDALECPGVTRHIEGFVRHAETALPGSLDVASDRAQNSDEENTLSLVLIAKRPAEHLT